MGKAATPLFLFAALAGLAAAQFPPSGPVPARPVTASATCMLDICEGSGDGCFPCNATCPFATLAAPNANYSLAAQVNEACVCLCNEFFASAFCWGWGRGRFVCSTENAFVSFFSVTLAHLLNQRPCGRLSGVL
jgi:hypothetical protein